MVKKVLFVLRPKAELLLGSHFVHPSRWALVLGKRNPAKNCLLREVNGVKVRVTPKQLVLAGFPSGFVKEAIGRITGADALIRAKSFFSKNSGKPLFLEGMRLLRDRWCYKEAEQWNDFLQKNETIAKEVLWLWHLLADAKHSSDFFRAKNPSAQLLFEKVYGNSIVYSARLSRGKIFFGMRSAENKK